MPVGAGLSFSNQLSNCLASNSSGFSIKVNLSPIFSLGLGRGFSLDSSSVLNDALK